MALSCPATWDNTLMTTLETTAPATETDPRERTVERIIGIVLGLLALFCGIAMVRIALIGWGNSLLDMHGFRQTQTAISSYYMQRGSGGLFNYETPVLGYPWEIPFEFPLYQWIVAIVSSVLHLPLAQTGRAVSEFFWIATLVLVWPILGEVKVRPAFRPLFLILLLVSPEYLFWSRTFTIESTVIFLGTAYLLCILRYLRRRHPLELIAGTILGCLAALVKITSLPAFAVLGLCAYAVAIYRSVESTRTPAALFQAAVREIVPLFLLFAAPVLVGAVWTAYADSVRAKNSIAKGRLLSSMLKDWTFGPLSQRFDKGTWAVFLRDRIRDAVGSVRVPLLAFACFAVARQRWKEGLLSLAAYLTPQLIFTNLFVVHNYYAYANALFLAIFVGFSILALLEKRKIAFQAAALIVLGYVVFVSLHRYELEYRKAQESNNTEAVSIGEAIRDHTNPDEVAVMVGLDWSPEVPFYAERRSLLIPDWITNGEPEKMTASINSSIQDLSSQKVGAVAVCRDVRTKTNILDTLLQHFNLKTKPVFTSPMCDVYDLDPATPGR